MCERERERESARKNGLLHPKRALNHPKPTYQLTRADHDGRQRLEEGLQARLRAAEVSKQELREALQEETALTHSLREKGQEVGK